MANKKLIEIPMKATEEIPLLLLEVEERDGQKGPFCVLTVCDGDTVTSAMMFDTKKQQIESMTDHIIKAHVYVDTYGGRSYKIKRCLVADEEYEIDDFIKSTPEKPEDYMRSILDTCKNTAGESSPLFMITKALYAKYKDELLKSSAARGMHHNLRGGLMMHTATMVKDAASIADNYPFVDKALLVCATALHDIGKIREIDTTVFGDASYTFEGNLFGHAYIGMNMVNEGAAAAGIDQESEPVMLLKHCIASHHGKLDWGAITTPMIPEAFILHAVDMIDSRMYQYNESAKELDPGTFSDRRNMMLETIVYRKKED